MLKPAKTSPFRGTTALITLAGLAVIVSGAIIWKLAADAATEVVQPVVEAQTFSGSGDIADDMAIWPNPTNPSQSLVIAANKADSGGGIGVFDLAGKMLSYKSIGKMANIDLRTNFMLAGQPITLIGVNRRDNSSLAFYKLNPDTKTVETIHARTIGTMSSNYGMCLYRSATKTYANVMSQSGAFQQFELFESAGKVDAKVVRTFSIGSISEGCVADDALGHLYINQEDVGVWKYSAEPSGGSARTSIAKVGDGRVVADVEGISIAKGPNNTGYIFVSSQGNDTYAIYDRVTNAWVKNFKVGSNGTIDGAEHTDGLDVTSANLGGVFSGGMLVVHDEFNSGSSVSNFKYVPLNKIITMSPEGGSTPTPTPTPIVTATPTPTPVTGTKVGDINADGNVNVFDLSVLLTNWSKTTANCDLNKDGTVNVFDLSILLSKWGS